MAAAQPQVLKHYINGKWVEPKGTVATDVMNPATDTALCRVPVATPEEVEECVQAAQKAFLSWRDVPGVQRIQPLLRLQITIKVQFFILFYFFKKNSAVKTPVRKGKKSTHSSIPPPTIAQLLVLFLCRSGWRRSQSRSRRTTERRLPRRAQAWCVRTR